MGRWTNTTLYPNLGVLADDDLLPIADASATVGSQQRTITLAGLRANVGGGTVTVNSYAGAHTLDEADDVGAHVRITAAGAVTIPPDLPVGWSCVIENATASATVSLAEGLGVALLSAGVEVANGKWVALVVVSANTVAAGGAFADEVGDAADLGSGAATDGHVLTADGIGGAAWEAVAGGGTTIPTELGTAVTLYVNAGTGNDTTGDGTSGTPYASISRAVEDIPAVVAAVYTINVADGTYREQVNLDRFVFLRFSYSTPSARIILTGNTTTPADCIISGANSGTPTTPTRDFCIAIGGRATVTVQGFSLQYAAVRGLQASGNSGVALGEMEYKNCATALLADGYSLLAVAGDQAITDCATGVYLTVFSRLNTDSGSRAITMTGVTLRGLYVVESTALLNSGDSLSIAAAASGTRLAGVEGDGQAVIDIPVTASVTNGFAYNIVVGAGSRVHVATASLTLTGAVTTDYLAADNGTVWDTTNGVNLAGGNRLLGAASTSRLLGAAVNADAHDRYELRASGQQRWGAGSAAADIFLSRTAPTGGTALELETGGLTEIRLWSNQASNTAKSSIQQTGLNGNLYLYANGRYDGTAFQRDDTAAGMAMLQISATGGFLFRYAAAGANPATLTTSLFVTAAGSVVAGAAAVATGATDGFLYIPTAAGAPTGTPTAHTGRAAMVLDTTNNRLYVRNGATWRYASLT